MFDLGFGELFFLGVIIILVIFGTAKLKNFGKDVGGAVKDFKDAVTDDKKDKNIQ